MSKQDDVQDSGKIDPLLQQAKALFDDSVDGLDGEVQSKLNQGRQRALAELDSSAVRFGNWSQWVPVTGIAAAAVIAVALLNVDSSTELSPPSVASDFELLLNDDTFEMLEDLEFYRLLELDANLQINIPETANVG